MRGCAHSNGNKIVSITRNSGVSSVHGFLIILKSMENVLDFGTVVIVKVSAAEGYLLSGGSLYTVTLQLQT